MTYPHDKHVRDWLDGTPMQYRDGPLWVDLPKPAVADKLPHFYPAGEYRHKPVLHRYRVAAVRAPDGTEKLAMVRSLQEETTATHLPTFIRWATNWIELGEPNS